MAARLSRMAIVALALACISGRPLCAEPPRTLADLTDDGRQMHAVLYNFYCLTLEGNEEGARELLADPGNPEFAEVIAATGKLNDARRDLSEKAVARYGDAADYFSRLIYQPLSMPIPGSQGPGRQSGVILLSVEMEDEHTAVMRSPYRRAERVGGPLLEPEAICRMKRIEGEWKLETLPPFQLKPMDLLTKAMQQTAARLDKLPTLFEARIALEEEFHTAVKRESRKSEKEG